MTKKTFKYAGVFALVFIAAFLIFFPYSSVVDALLLRQIASNKLPVTYAKVESGLFHTAISDVTVSVINGDSGVTISLGDINFSYSPLSLLTHGVKAHLDSSYGTAAVRYGRSGADAEATLNVSRLANTLGFRASGSLGVNVRYNNKEGKGVFNLSSGAFTFFLPGFGPVNGDSLTAEGTIAGNFLTVTSLETAGEGMVLEDVKGPIFINMTDFQRSSLNLTGKASFMGLKSDFNIRGPFGNLQFSMQTPLMK